MGGVQAEEDTGSDDEYFKLAEYMPNNPLDIQEFMILPVRETVFSGETSYLCGNLSYAKSGSERKGLQTGVVGMKADLRLNLQIRKKRFGR